MKSNSISAHKILAKTFYQFMPATLSN